MRNLIIVLSGIAALIIVGAVVFVGKTKVEASASILTVLQKREGAWSRSINEKGRINIRQYLTRIEEIDVRACPEDFRSAWGNYIGSLKADTRTFFINNSRDVGNAFEECKQVAIRHGVTFKNE